VILGHQWLDVALTYVFMGFYFDNSSHFFRMIPGLIK
jgi:hypothetical protein